MNIVYASTCCSNKKMSELQEKGIFKGIVCAQKYHLLLIKGLAENEDCKVSAVSAISTNRKWTNKIFFKTTEEKDDKVDFFYSGFINFPFFRQILLFFNTLKIICNLCRKGKENIIVCDILNQSIAASARIAGKLFNVPVVGIVTDVPGHFVGDEIVKSSKNPITIIKNKYKEKNIHNYDAYLFLTQAMDDIVNINNKPYIVIEGHSDISMAQKNNTIEEKQIPNVIMYAGGVSKIYGIEMLVHAFEKLDPDNWELHIYGKGDYEEELIEFSKKYKKVKFLGLLPNAEIVDRQIKATVLVNPRPTNEEYVKYSFPSKTLECMVSGTPLITTQLPGMPTEYNKYVYIFKEESMVGYAETLKNIISIDKQELHNKGKTAKEFALSEKNNVCQANKFYNFLKTLVLFR